MTVSVALRSATNDVQIVQVRGGMALVTPIPIPIAVTVAAMDASAIVL